MVYCAHSDNSHRHGPSRSKSGSTFEGTPYTVEEASQVPYSVGMTSCSLYACMQLGGYGCDAPQPMVDITMTTSIYAGPYPQRQGSCASLLLFDLLEVLAVVPFFDMDGNPRGKRSPCRETTMWESGIPPHAKLPHHTKRMNQWPKPGQYLCPGSRNGAAADQQTFNCLDVAPRTERLQSSSQTPNGSCCRPREWW